MIARGMATKDILVEVRASADRIYRAENPPEPELVLETEPTPEPMPGPIVEPITQPETAKVEESAYYANYRITGTESQLLSVSQFLKSNGITYKVTEQGEI